MVVLPTVDDTRDFGRRLAAVLRAGDLVILDGPLGAGKTALAQGIGAGLGVRGEVTAPLTPSPAPIPWVSAVLPAPSGPVSTTRSPGRRIAAS